MRSLTSASVVFVALVAACSNEYTVLQGPVDVDPADITECPFTPIPGTRFQRYDCNPVFTGTDEDWIAGGVGSVGFHAEEVLGHAFYQMWYSTRRAGGQYGLGYAISADGTNWEPLEANPVHVDPGQGWNRDTMGAVTVVWDNDAKQYVITYQGVNYDTNANGLGVITSPDGQVWTPANDGKPFVNLSEQIGEITYCWPLALTWNRGVGYQGYIGGVRNNGDQCHVFGYGGADLNSIRPDGDRVVLRAGPDGSHDAKGVASAAVVKFEDTYYMFYVGFRDWQPIQGTNFISPYDSTLSIATSSDGISWQKSEDNPILPVSLVTGPSVLGNVAAQVVGRRIHLWIDDYYESIGTSGVGYFLYEPHIDKHP